MTQQKRQPIVGVYNGTITLRERPDDPNAVRVERTAPVGAPSVKDVEAYLNDVLEEHFEYDVRVDLTRTDQ